MRLDQPNDRWLQQLIDGEDQTALQFWNQYGNRLNRLADKFLSPKLARRVDAEDVVQSVCRTFFRRAQNGQFTIADAESLWRLLCTITIAKVRMEARKQCRKKRSVDREEPIYAFTGESDDSPRELCSGDPTSEEIVEFADELERLLSNLEQEEQQLVELKLQDYDNNEIAQRLQCSARTVRRILKRVQSRLQAMLELTGAERNTAARDTEP